MKRLANNENVKSETTKAPAIRAGREQPEVTRLDLTARVEPGASAKDPLSNQSAPAVEPYIDKYELARRLGRTVRAVEKMMRNGRIPYYKWDFRASFLWSEVQARIAQTRGGPNQGSRE